MWHKRIEIFVWPVLLMALACGDSGDTPPGPGGSTQPSISIGNQVVVEGNTAVVTVSLDKTGESRVIFDYTTADISAVAGSDYTIATGTDTIQVGSLSAAILVTTIDDFDVEGAEEFAVALSSVSGATVATSLGTCTINDNDNFEVSFASQLQPLLRTSCAQPGNCHGGTLPGGGLYFGINAAYDTVINATGSNTALLPASSDGRVVQPGDAGISTLYLTVDTIVSLPFPSLMPSGASPLSLAQQNLIKNWIDQGAQDN